MAEINRAQFLRLGVAGVVDRRGRGCWPGPPRRVARARAPGRRRRLPVVRRGRRAASAGWYRGRRPCPPSTAPSAGASRSRAPPSATTSARINAASAPTPSSPATSSPPSTTRVRHRGRRALAGRRVESLLVSVYLNGAAFADERPRACCSAACSPTTPSSSRGCAASAARRRRPACPVPLTLEQAGTTLDTLVTTPTSPCERTPASRRRSAGCVALLVARPARSLRRPARRRSPSTAPRR